MTGVRVRSHRLGLVVAVSLLALAGCSSSKKTATTATTATSSGSGATATTAAASGTGASGSSNESAKLGSIAESVKAGEQATYKAVYTYSGEGANGPITIEQAPPKSLFKTGQSEAIDTGTATYYCSTAGTVTCISEGTGSANPLAGITQLFSPQSAESAIEAAQAEAAANVAGDNISFSTQSFGGVSADCVSLTAASQTGKYCVTKDGVLAYSGTATASFQLTSYTTNVSPSDFALPAGATIQTIPAIP